MFKQFQKQLPFHVFVGLGVVYLIIFSYIPMFGILIAFKNYKISTGIEGIFTSSWAGLSHFKELIDDYNFPNLLRNTLMLSILKVIFSLSGPDSLRYYAKRGETCGFEKIRTNRQLFAAFYFMGRCNRYRIRILFNRVRNLQTSCCYHSE